MWKKTGIASRVRALGEGRRCGLVFRPRAEHSLSVVVGDIRKLLPPGPVHRIFEPLERTRDGKSKYKCRWRTAFLSPSALRHGWRGPTSRLRPAQLRSHGAPTAPSPSAAASQHLLPPRSFHFLIFTCYKKGERAPLQRRLGAPSWKSTTLN